MSHAAQKRYFLVLSGRNMLPVRTPNWPVIPFFADFVNNSKSKLSKLIAIIGFNKSGDDICCNAQRVYLDVLYKPQMQ